jgi:hypothetical protein
MNLSSSRLSGSGKSLEASWRMIQCEAIGSKREKTRVFEFVDLFDEPFDHFIR